MAYEELYGKRVDQRLGDTRLLPSKFTGPVAGPPPPFPSLPAQKRRPAPSETTSRCPNTRCHVIAAQCWYNNLCSENGRQCSWRGFCLWIPRWLEKMDVCLQTFLHMRSVLCRKHLQGPMLHAILSACEVKQKKNHSPHLSLLAHSGAIDSQLSTAIILLVYKFNSFQMRFHGARGSHKAPPEQGLCIIPRRADR